jgi:hypothetical protein
MSNYPSVKAKDFIKVIEQLGFYFDRQKGVMPFIKMLKVKGLSFRSILGKISNKALYQGCSKIST